MANNRGFVFAIFPTGQAQISLTGFIGNFINLLFSKIKTIRKIIDVTQSDSPLGGSFGLCLTNDSQLHLNQKIMLLGLTIILITLMIRGGGLPIREFMESHSYSTTWRWLSTLMLSYFAIWVSGDNFIYGMSILLPLVFILSTPEVCEIYWVKAILYFIFVTLITGRLPVTIVLSSSLAIYFAYMVFKFSQQHLLVSIDWKTHLRRFWIH